MNISLLTSLCGPVAFWLMVGISMVTTSIALGLALKLRDQNALLAFRSLCLAPMVVGLLGTFNQLLVGSMAVEDPIVYLEMVLAPLVVAGVLVVPAWAVSSLAHFGLALRAAGFRWPVFKVVRASKSLDAESITDEPRGRLTYDDMVRQLHQMESDA